MSRCLITLTAMLAWLFWPASACPAQPTPPGFPLRFDFNDSKQKWANQSPIDGQSVSEWTDSCGRTGGGIHMKGTGGPPDQMRVWRKVVPNPPIARQLHLRAWAKGTNVDNVVAVVMQAHAPQSAYLAGYATTQIEQPLKGDFDWTELKATLDVPRGCANVQVLLMLVGNGEVWFDDVDIELGGEATLIVPGVFLVKGELTVASTDAANTTAALLIPLPLFHADQAPLTFGVRVEPAERLQSISYKSIGMAQNWVASVKLQGLTTTDDTRVSWESVVLAAPTSFNRVPANMPLPAQWGEEARWLTPTRSVQADDPAIKEAAAETRGGSHDIMEIIKATLERARTIFAGQEGRCTELDAVQALTKQGSCTSAANLIAALLRANRIPARVVAGYPAWSGPLQTHYIVEAYVPEYGWYPIEPSLLRAPWPSHQQINVSIVTPENENASAARASGAGGVPYLSLTEHEPRDAPIRTSGTLGSPGSGCDHECVPLRNFPEDTPPSIWKQLLEKAEHRWQRHLQEWHRPPSEPARDWFKQATPETLLKELAGD